MSTNPEIPYHIPRSRWEYYQTHFKAFFTSPREAVTLFYRKAAYHIAKSVLKRRSMCVKVWDYRLNIPLDQMGIGGALAKAGYREPDHRYILKQQLRPGATVFDLGANIGYYVAMEAKLMDYRGTIVACEPDPRNQEVLKSNLRLNGIEQMVTFLPWAVSNKDGTADFQLAGASNLSGLQRTTIPVDDRTYVGTVPVRIRDFCGLLDELGKRFDVVRMDIEGHEYEVFEGLASRLEKDPAYPLAPQAFLFEPHPWEYREGRDFAEILRRLGRHGYRVTALGTCDERLKLEHHQPTALIPAPMEDCVYRIYSGLPQPEAIELACGVLRVTTVELQRGV